MSLLQDRVVRQAVVVTAAMRVALGIVGWVANRSPLSRPSGDPLFYATAGNRVLNALLGPWQRFDAINYQRIAIRGYPHGADDTEYHPLFPALLKVVSIPLGGRDLSYIVAGLLISTVAFACAYVVVYRLVEHDFDADIAGGTLLLLVSFPLAFIYFAGYTESVFLLLTAGCFLALRRHSLVLAGGLAAAATLCRPQGIALAGPLLVAVVLDMRDRRREGRPALRPAHASVLAAPATFLAYYAWAASDVGVDPLTAQRHAFALRNVAPWTSIIDAINYARSGVPATGWSNVAAAIALLAGLALMIRRVPLDYILYTALAAIPILCRETLSFGALGPLKGTDRYIAVLFPLFVVAALLTRRAPWLRYVIAAGFAVLMVRTFVYFVHNDYVS
jgi:hypothetical protein